MDRGTLFLMVALGVGAGIAGGLFGIGGGLIIVPFLVLAFGYSQGAASGTSLFAQLFPVALLAVWEYNRRGEVHFKSGALIALGLVLGTFLGAWFAGNVPKEAMKRGYGAFLVAVGLYFLLFTKAK